MQQHINECAEVKDMGIAIYLLKLLPTDYDMIKSTLESQLNDTLMLHFVMYRLLKVEELKSERNLDNNHAAVLNDNAVFRD